MEDDLFLDAESITSSELDDVYKRVASNASEAQEASLQASIRCQALEAELAERETKIVDLESQLVSQWKACRHQDAPDVELAAMRRTLDDAKSECAKLAVDLATADARANAARAQQAAADDERVKLEARLKTLVDEPPVNDTRRRRALALERAQTTRLDTVKRDADAVVKAATATVAELRASLGAGFLYDDDE